MTQTKIPVDLILESLAQSAEETQKRITRASDVLLSPLNTDLAGTPHEIVIEALCKVFCPTVLICIWWTGATRHARIAS